MSLSTESLPVLDLRRAGDPATAEAFQRELRDATGDYGFFYLVGHDIPEELSDELIAVSREFFALSEEQKLALDKSNSPHFRGYTRVGGEITKGAQDWREQIDIGPEREPRAATPDAPWAVLDGPNQWPRGPAAVPRRRSSGGSSRPSGSRGILLRSWLLAWVRRRTPSMTHSTRRARC